MFRVNTVSSSTDDCPTFLVSEHVCWGSSGAAAAAAAMSTNQAEVNTQCQANSQREMPTFESRPNQL